MSFSPSLSSAVFDDLYNGILECRDTVKLLSMFALNEGADNDDLGLMTSPLDLLERRLSELAFMVDPGVLANRVEIMEESHV
jgi:hypothetical protein